MNRIQSVLWLGMGVVFAAVCPVEAWHDEGHYYIARAAVEALPQEMPAFFRTADSRDAIAHGALDPDVIRSRALPQLRAASAPEHFIDLELLEGRPLPSTRYDYIALCVQLGIDAGRTGTLPYAITERAQWLTMAFAEHRRWPDNPHIQRKCVVLAGILAHYTADLHMPLHTTLHHDGRVERNDAGALVRVGPRIDLHARVDALPTKIPYAVLFEQAVTIHEPRADLFVYVVEELAKSHALVDKVYDLERRIPARGDLSLEDEQVRAFTIERVREAAAFTAGIYLSAWRNSADLAPPDWLDRTIFDERFDPAAIPAQP